LNRFRHSIGLTDEWHGHLRPGYSLPGLRQLLQPYFEIERARTYSRTFSEVVDTILNGVYQAVRRGKGGDAASAKGNIVGQGDVKKYRKQFLLLRTLYPVFWATARLDTLLPLQTGYKLIVQARRRPEESRSV
jgi:hypothetical protein